MSGASAIILYVSAHVYAVARKTLWPSGLRRWLKAPVRKGVGSNPTAVNLLKKLREIYYLMEKLPGGFEPPSLDSESRVLTVTP